MRFFFKKLDKQILKHCFHPIIVVLVLQNIHQLHRFLSSALSIIIRWRRLWWALSVFSWRPSRTRRASLWSSANNVGLWLSWTNSLPSVSFVLYQNLIPDFTNWRKLFIDLNITSCILTWFTWVLCYFIKVLHFRWQKHDQGV